MESGKIDIESIRNYVSQPSEYNAFYLMSISTLNTIIKGIIVRENVESFLDSRFKDFNSFIDWYNTVTKIPVTRQALTDDYFRKYNKRLFQYYTEKRKELESLIEGTNENYQEGLTKDEVTKWADEVKNRLGLKQFDVWLYGKDTLKLHLLIVPKEKRKQNLGSSAMKELCDFADRYHVKIILSTATKDDNWGTTSTTRLISFYKRFGFVDNRGRNTDYTISGNMYRNPKG